MSDEKQTAWDDAHSLGIALRLAQAQNRELRKANNQMREALETAARRFVAPEFGCDWQDAADEIHDLLAKIDLKELSTPPMSDK